MNVGFVGLGQLGSPIAQRIAAAGYPLSVWARRSSGLDGIDPASIRLARDLVDLGTTSDVVCLCVTDEPDVVEVLRGGLLDGMRSGGVVVVHSTVHPDACERFARLARPHGIGILDAPLCGGPAAAANSTLPIPVGGDELLFQQCHPLLSTYGGLIRHCGPLGFGQRVKLVFNLLYAANIEIVYDALQVGSRLGVDRDILADFVTDFPYRGYVGGRLATGRAGPEEVRHHRENLRKDVTYMLRLLGDKGRAEGKLGALALAGLESLRAYLEVETEHRATACVPRATATRCHASGSAVPGGTYR